MEMVVRYDEISNQKEPCAPFMLRFITKICSMCPASSRVYKNKGYGRDKARREEEHSIGFSHFLSSYHS